MTDIYDILQNGTEFGHCDWFTIYRNGQPVYHCPTKKIAEQWIQNQLDSPTRT